jgi:hypothetical protein
MFHVVLIDRTIVLVMRDCSCGPEPPSLQGGPAKRERYSVVGPPVEWDRPFFNLSGACVTAYWILFVIWAAGAIQFARQRVIAYDRILYLVAATLTALMIGLRYEVGGDWSNYIVIYENIAFQPLGPALKLSDPGYAFLNWFSAQMNWGLWFVDLICGILFMAGLARLALRQPNPWLAILVAVPYLIIVVAMGYTRQAAAIGIICWAVADARANRVVRIVLLVGFGALFHKTAILFLPLLLVPVITRNFLFGIAGAVVFAVLFNAFLGGASDQLVSTYATGNYDSQGAGIRVAMNVVAAGLMLAFRNRMGFDDFIKSFWTICSVLAIVSVVALVVLSSSSGVDRLSLFLIPLQAVTYSRLPYALSRTGRPLPSVVLGVIVYSVTVQAVWLNFADNAWAWVPYQNVVTADQG